MNNPNHSRFAINMANKEQLPVFPLLEPDRQGGSGAVLVGDYIANDFVRFHQERDPNFRDKWLVASTTQSDAVPTEVDTTDLNLFSNANGMERYRQSKANRVMSSLALADGLFVDPEIFKPSDTEEDPEYDIMYVAKWFPTKNTGLLLDVARARPDIRVGLYGWLMASERKRAESERYREELVSGAEDLPNVTVMDSEQFSTEPTHINPDGSVVLGALTKEEVRDRFINRSRVGAYLSQETEAVNRSCIEALMCDKPLVVALPTEGGMERFMQDGKTSLFCDRTPEGIIGAYDEIVEHREDFTPRETALTFGGKEAANSLLRKLLAEAAAKKGVKLSSADWIDYGGDLWTPHDTYAKIS